MRTLVLQLQRKVGIELPPDSPILPRHEPHATRESASKETQQTALDVLRKLHTGWPAGFGPFAFWAPSFPCVFSTGDIFFLGLSDGQGAKNRHFLFFPILASLLMKNAARLKNFR